MSTIVGRWVNVITLQVKAAKQQKPLVMVDLFAIFRVMIILMWILWGGILLYPPNIYIIIRALK